MREILFRGKRVDNGKWVEGFLSKSRNIEEKPALLKPCIDYEEKGVMVSSIVDPETVGQLTGLTDKNGNKIFEGDIVQRKVNVYRLGEREPSGERILTGIVVWETHQHCTGSWALSAYDEFGNKANYLFDDSFEVVGNIHDNPELLEGSNK